MDIAYLNGDFLPIEEARVPVLDRGFIFGDGVYEFIPCYDGKPLCLEEHLDRLSRSCTSIQLTNPHSRQEWLDLIHQLIIKNGEGNLGIYLQLSRGVAKRDHVFPKNTRPTVFMMANPLTGPPQEQIDNGIPCVSMEDNRWLRCDIKSTSLLGNVLLRQAAINEGCSEVVLFREGYLTEGSASNILVVLNNTLLAPVKNNLILAGITSDLIIKLCASHGIPVETRQITQDEVKSADELILTSSGRELLAITHLDEKAIGNGKPGPIFHMLYKLYQEHKTRTTLL